MKKEKKLITSLVVLLLFVLPISFAPIWLTPSAALNETNTTFVNNLAGFVELAQTEYKGYPYSPGSADYDPSLVFYMKLNKIQR